MNANPDFSEIQPYTGEPPVYPAEPVPNGQVVPMMPMAPMLQAKTQYMTAVQVQKPRDLDKVVAAVMREAELAGEAFYWAWTVKNKKTGKREPIDGPSIGLAMCVAREWTNVAVPVDYQETAGFDIFTAHFVDLERGFTISRVWRQKKGPNKNLDAWGERAESMTFQAAQSRAIRNAVLAGVPKWLVDQAKEKAKEAVLRGITPEKLAAAREQSVKVFGARGVSEERLVAALGLPVAQWGSQEIVTLKGMLNQIKDGQASAEDLFPAVEEKKAPAAAPEQEKKAFGKAKATEPPRGITQATTDKINTLAAAKGFHGDKLLNICGGVPVVELTEAEGLNVVKNLEALTDVIKEPTGPDPMQDGAKKPEPSTSKPEPSEPQPSAPTSAPQAQATEGAAFDWGVAPDGQA